MKNFIAIMNWNSSNRVAKFQDFDVEADAVNHVSSHTGEYPEAFVVPTPSDSFMSWLVDPVAKQVMVDFPVVTPPTLEERMDAAFPQTDSARAIFNAFFNMENRIRALESKPAITKSQLRKWFESQLD